MTTKDHHPAEAPVAYGVTNKDGVLWVCDFGLATIIKGDADHFASWAPTRWPDDAPFAVVGFHAHYIRDLERLARVRALADEFEHKAYECGENGLEADSIGLREAANASDARAKVLAECASELRAALEGSA